MEKKLRRPDEICDQLLAVVNIPASLKEALEKFKVDLGYRAPELAREDVDRISGILAVHAKVEELPEQVMVDLTAAWTTKSTEEATEMVRKLRTLRGVA
jgi:hypothetical protein